MRKVLIVGLGGSGGKTLAFLMDELKVRLGENWPQLPQCWKFVHIDVPSMADTMGNNLATPVAQQGGKYVGLASDSVPYSSYDKAAMDVLGKQFPSALDLAARWRPEPRDADLIAVSGGAGAYRAVGRMLTVAKADSIYKVLQQAISELSTPAANADLAKLSGDGGGDDDEPLVFMVSSLAGGSGASMVLDVADMLRGLTVNAGFDGLHTAAFLYTSDVFKSLGIGKTTGPGSLATISELISALQRHDEPWTKKEWEALGISQAAVPGVSVRGRGPAVIFPVGAKAGGLNFGEAPEDVYRGFARMLVPLLDDGEIQGDFFAYVTVNHPQLARKSGDATGLFRDPITSELPSIPHFSAWGSSVLTMGRERYTEYAAQRVAREAVEVLVNGFSNQDFIEKRINLDEAIKQGADQVYGSFLGQAGLLALQSSDITQLTRLIFTPEIGNSMIQPHSAQVSSAFTGKTVDLTATALASYWRSSAKVMSDAENAAIRALATWSMKMQSDLEQSFLQVAGTRGLRVAAKCLDLLASALIGAQAALRNSVKPSALVSQVTKAISELKASNKGSIAAGSPAANNFVNGFIGALGSEFLRVGAQTLAEVIDDFVKNYIDRLRDSANRTLAELDYELSRDARSVVTAAFHSAAVCQWPTSDGLVPPHFEPAVNEILVEGVDTFPNRFVTHVAQAVAPIAGNETREGARQVITRTLLEKSATGNGLAKVVGWEWSQTPLGGDPTVNRTSPWQPKAFSLIDGRPQSAAAFSLKLGYADVLEAARHWVNLPASPFRQHTDQGIAAWLNPNEPISDRERQERYSQLRTKFQQARTLASPLVEIDNGTVSTVHGADVVGTSYTFSSIPFDQNHELVRELKDSMDASETGLANASKLLAACQPTQDVAEIFIIGQPAYPILPMAIKSLMEPIRNQWQSAVTADGTLEFWKWRRARPLRQFVPVSQRNIAAFIQGWAVGRITGQIQLFDLHDGTKGVKVQDPKTGSWLEFPRKPLASKALGIKSNAPGLDESAWNVPAILLETLPLAMSHVQGLDTSALDPYLTVIRMGASLKVAPVENEPTGAPANVLNPLDVWFMNGPSAGFEPQIKSAQGDSPQDRMVNAKKYLESVRDYMHNLVSAQVTLANINTINREYEIAPEVVSACSAVIRELDRPDLGYSTDGDNLIASQQQSLAQSPVIGGGAEVEG